MKEFIFGGGAVAAVVALINRIPPSERGHIVVHIVRGISEAAGKRQKGAT